jgi:hypothetical protein
MTVWLAKMALPIQIKLKDPSQCYESTEACPPKKDFKRESLSTSGDCSDQQVVESQRAAPFQLLAGFIRQNSLAIFAKQASLGTEVRQWLFAKVQK